MNCLVKGFNRLTQFSTKTIQLRNGLKIHKSFAFESTFSQPIDLSQSEDYRKDLPDPSLANPYQKARRKCILCQYGIEVDHKNVQLLTQFVSPYTGRLYDKHITGLCEKQQQVLRREHQKAVRYSLISPVYRDTKYFKDPKLFDPTRPERPNPY